MPHSELVIDGERWPSVTEVLQILSKPQLNRWREYKGTKEADRISKESAYRGRRLHELVEMSLKGESVTFCGEEKELQPIFMAWFKWYTESGYRCVSQEIKVQSTKYKYHGTFDALLELPNNQLCLVDWKFSNNDDHFRWLQLAGYAQAYKEHINNNLQLKIQNGMIVRIDKKGKVHIKECHTLWQYIPLFLACRKLWDFVNSLGKFKKK